MRLEIMRRTDLALRAIQVLHELGRRTTAAELAERLESTPQFVPQVMNQLVRAGWVASEPGPKGGYRLEVDPSGHSMLEFIELIEGPIDDGRCVLRHGPCAGRSTCAMHEAWVTARTALVSGLRALPVA